MDRIISTRSHNLNFQTEDRLTRRAVLFHQSVAGIEWPSSTEQLAGRSLDLACGLSPSLTRSRYVVERQSGSQQPSLST